MSTHSDCKVQFSKYCFVVCLCLLFISCANQAEKSGSDKTETDTLQKDESNGQASKQNIAPTENNLYAMYITRNDLITKIRNNLSGGGNVKLSFQFSIDTFTTVSRFTLALWGYRGNVYTDNRPNNPNMPIVYLKVKENKWVLPLAKGDVLGGQKLRNSESNRLFNEPNVAIIALLPYKDTDGRIAFQFFGFSSMQEFDNAPFSYDGMKAAIRPSWVNFNFDSKPSPPANDTP